MTTVARNVLLLATVLSAAWACSSGSTPVDIGDGRTGQSLEDYAAHWEGYAEAHDFADGSDKVKLTLDTLGNGTLEIGNSAPLPIATNPEAGYPPSYTGDPSLEQFSRLFPGFAYTITTATVESARIRFLLNPWQIERDWCALQTSHDNGSPGSAGGGSGGGGNVGGGPALPPGLAVGPDSGHPYGLGRYQCVPLPAPPGACSDVNPASPNCEKGQLCWNEVCACDAQGCSYYVPPSGQPATVVRLDAALDDAGESLVGTLKIGNGGQVSVTVRLKRIAND